MTDPTPPTPSPPPMTGWPLNCSRSPWRPHTGPVPCCATAARTTWRVAATKSSPIDVVTEMDIAAEKLITGFLAERRPDDGFLGEEGASSEGRSGVRWVIDPLDGTVNYLYGLPTWAVSIAAERDGETLAGVVEIPMRRETFRAVRGGGAQLNGRPVGPRPAPATRTGAGVDRIQLCDHRP